MIRALGQRFAAFFRATTPDPLVLAVLLTVVALGGAFALTNSSPAEVIRAWQGDAGFWSLLAFGMQMVLILVTGHALASAPPVSRLLQTLASRPVSAPGAAAMVSFVAMATGLLNWGLGLIVGAILARDTGRSLAARGIPCHYPILAAAGYTGLLCWHGGLSGTAPLMVTSEENLRGFLGPELAARTGPVPFTETVLSPANLLVSLGLLLLIPALAAALCPRAGDPVEGIDAFAPGPPFVPTAPSRATIPERLEASPWVAALIVIPLLAAVGLWMSDVGITQLDPNALNLLFLALGIGLHGSLRQYGAAVHDAVSGASGIVLQFPFYAGIMGVMRVTGLAAMFSSSIVNAVSATWFPLATVGSAAIVNLFVPSGGGQWAVQGPIAMEAALHLGLSPATAVMSVAYGDQLTNMLQPFWALPLLAVTGVRAKDIIGYTAVLMIAATLWIGVLVTVIPF